MTIVTTGRLNNTTYPVNIPQCFVDIYTPEGGQYQLIGAPLLRVATRVNIMAETNEFSLMLAPGGPLGSDVSPTWTEVITPMSLAIIGMRRGVKQQVVMVGIVQGPEESQEWVSGEPVRRSIVIRGRDFSHYFAMFSYYALWYLGATGVMPGSESGQIGLAAALTSSLPPILGYSLVSGRPDQIAQAWWQVIMGGKAGIMARTYVNFRGQRVLFPDAVATLIEQYDVLEPNGYADYLMTEGSWRSKFQSILPYPWYEFFVLTAPTAYYPEAQGGYQFKSSGLGDISASPTLVGRVNPLPNLVATLKNGAPQFTGIDVTAWNALQVFDLQGYGHIESTVGFDESLVLNFFNINPTSMLGQNGQSNSDFTTFIMGTIGAADVASIQRYGYRPANGATTWLADPSGGLAEGGNNSQQFLANMLARFCSIYEPMALMAHGEARTFLRPDIMPGNVFRYAPFKDGVTWDFYIEGVAHDFTFGGPATTTLTLTRGLPSSVYADQSATGLLYQIHVGNAERIDGVYKPTLPPGSAPSLQPIGVGQFQQFFAGIAKAYVTPQAQDAAP